MAEANRQLARDLAKIPNAHVFDYAGVVSGSGACGGPTAACGTWLAASPARRTWCLWLATWSVGSALLRPAAKCLVLDLDGTLWGACLGDDGVGRIKLGDDYPATSSRIFRRRCSVCGGGVLAGHRQQE